MAGQMGAAAPQKGVVRVIRRGIMLWRGLVTPVITANSILPDRKRKSRKIGKLYTGLIRQNT